MTRHLFVCPPDARQAITLAADVFYWQVVVPRGDGAFRAAGVPTHLGPARGADLGDVTYLGSPDGHLVDTKIAVWIVSTLAADVWKARVRKNLSRRP